MHTQTTTNLYPGTEKSRRCQTASQRSSTCRLSASHWTRTSDHLGTSSDCHSVWLANHLQSSGAIQWLLMSIVLIAATYQQWQTMDRDHHRILLAEDPFPPVCVGLPGYCARRSADES